MAIEQKKPTKRSINALETKNTIFSTALSLFAKYGYDKVTIEDIARHAKVSKGNFYTHFDSKDSVLVEQFFRIDAHYINVFKKVAADEPAGNRLRIFIAAMCDYCQNVCGINAIQVVYANQVSANKHVHILDNKERPFYHFLREIITQGQNSGEFRTDINLEEMVEITARFARALLYDWCLSNNAFALQTEGDKYTDFILSALKKSTV